MTTAADRVPHRPVEAETPPGETAAPSPLTLLPVADATDAGVCADGFCRLPGAASDAAASD